jgi:hypothetical protein
MSDVRDLLRRHGAPLPNAVMLTTEVRTEGSLAFQTLNVPDWVEQVKPSSALGEWRCTLPSQDVDALQALLKTVIPAPGKTNQQLINEALQALDIGSYMGTFIEEGLLVDGSATVRMMFAYRTTTLADMAGIKRKLHGLITAPDPQHADASAALLKLRAFWSGGSDKWEGGLMLLSEVNLYDPAVFPFTGAKLGKP